MEKIAQIEEEMVQLRKDYKTLHDDVGAAEAKAYGRLTDLAAQVDELRKQNQRLNEELFATRAKVVAVASQREVGFDLDVLREALAAYAHDAWSGWMQYEFSKCSTVVLPDGTKGKVIPEWAVERWTRQMQTPYNALPEEEKKSDREEADKILAILVELIGRKEE